MSLGQDTTDEVELELTPLELDENTSVKVPVVHPSYPLPGQVPKNCDSELEASLTCAPDEDVSNLPIKLTDEQLDKLVSSYDSFPRELFKNSLLKWYASCDKKLNEVRHDLFTILCSKDGFPFSSSILKRRAQRRNGDSLAEKLAYHVHTLIAGLVDGDYDNSEFKSLISSRSKSVSTTVAHPGPDSLTPAKKECSSQRISEQPSRSEFCDMHFSASCRIHYI